MSPTTGNRALQFNLASLVFWMFVCAVVAGIARSLIESGEKARDYLICFAALGAWLVMTFVTIYLRVFLQRRWTRSAAMRAELEQLVKRRREERAEADNSATSFPSPGP